jgi:NADH:ubiquinone oxidoreductase subunit C
MTDTPKYIQSAREKFRDDILDVTTRNEKRATITIKPASLLPVADFFFSEMGFRFVIATALHTRQGLEIYYHFSDDPAGLVLNLHVVLPVDRPEIESLTGMFEAANWIEREMHEILGINFLNHPNLEKLISEGNWAEGVYPYRK